MRHFAFILVSLTLLITGILGCKKDQQPSELTIVGSWEIRSAEGGLGSLSYTYPPGNGFIYKFSKDSTFQLIDSNQVIQSGTFSMVYGSFYGGHFEYLLFLKNNYGSTGYYFNLELEKIRTYSGYSTSDGYYAIYARLH